jgi:hypothetical protein
MLLFKLPVSLGSFGADDKTRQPRSVCYPKAETGRLAASSLPRNSSGSPRPPSTRLPPTELGDCFRSLIRNTDWIIRRWDSRLVVSLDTATTQLLLLLPGMNVFCRK